MYVEARKKLVGWLRSQLIGPAGEGSVRMSPLDRYPTGVLHPVEPDVAGIDPASTGRDDAESNLHDEPDEDEEATHSGPESDAPMLARPARRRRYVPPSSVGFSCYVRGHVRLSVTAAAAVYRGTEERGERGRSQAREYTRSELPEGSATLTLARAQKWDCIHTHIGLGAGEYRLVVKAGSTSIEVPGEPRISPEVERDRFFELLSGARVDHSTETKVRRELGG